LSDYVALLMDKAAVSRLPDKGRQVTHHLNILERAIPSVDIMSSTRKQRIAGKLVKHCSIRRIVKTAEWTCSL
jgi:predicted dinucleotide-utilizing enzyme